VPGRVGSGIRIEVIQVKDLIRFSEHFFQNSAGQVLAPISRPRALGTANNPFADPHDPALIVAYDCNKVVGHYGIVPGLLKTPQGNSKVLWGSALFIHPDYRLRGVFLDLIQTVYSFKMDFVITELNDAVYQIYKMLGFHELKPLEICWLNIAKLDLFVAARWFARNRVKIPEAVLKIADKLTPITRPVIHSPLRFLYLSWLAHAACKELAGIGFREVPRVRPEAVTPLGSSHFVRGAEAVNWMLEYPWLTQIDSAADSASDPPYHFSERRDLFSYYAIEFDDLQGSLAGYLIFSIQAHSGIRILKLTDFSVCSNKDLATVFWIAALYAARHRVDHLYAASAMSPFMSRTPLSRFLVRSVPRRYLCKAVKGGRLEKVFDELELQYGDGDCVFT
jgi:hypothetical protein